jgi:hypothetical protein
VSQGPWSADLESTFTDPVIRQQVDGFLREKVQPYTTKLEQELAPAKSLWDDFHSKPRETFLEVATDIYGEDGAKALAEYLDSQSDGGDAAAQALVEEAGGVQPTPRDPEVQAIIDERNEARDKAAFRADFEAVKAAHPEVDLDFDLFVPHVAAHGDYETAVASYVAQEARVAARLAPADPNAAPAPTPPPVVGAGASGPTTPPQAKQYGADLGAAIDDWANEVQAGGQSVIPTPPAPPVAA